MTILNLMLGSGRGGLEQAAIDYAQALNRAAIPSISVVAPKAWVADHLAAAHQRYETLPHWGSWDMCAAYRLRRLANHHEATAILCHGNRALSLALQSLGGRIPVIAVAHNYKTRRFAKADACFAITQHLAAHLTSQGIQHITLMPNMVRLEPLAPRPAFRSPPVIGSLGRFVPKKGFLLFIEALAIMHQRGIAFRALLGGEGEEAATIDAHIAQHELQGIVERIGWVADKTAFFQSLDLFVLPSHHEPFGIALIEAMSHAVPVISTDSEGPSEILHHNVDGLLVPKKDPEALANAIGALLQHPIHAQSLGAAGATLVATTYSMDAMAKRLQTALKPYIHSA